MERVSKTGGKKSKAEARKPSPSKGRQTAKIKRSVAPNLSKGRSVADLEAQLELRTKEAAERIEKIRVAWSLQKPQLEQGLLSRIDSSKFLDILLPTLKRDGFTRSFGDNEIYRLVVETNLISTFKGFSQVATSVASFEELENSLAVTKDAILGVDERLAEARREEARRWR